ncbi:ABC transporter ATP-binding protein [Alsobacter sp. SYSU M60028]|uniref:ABC transporter ATP-binding protein n=1 Tax=Alsobacter ponti TaxID=2962936 RepID=A0ABT1LCA0_9HYPH|nr:ABC transporter ATP-binding protein [Alsobacter ponti]MCP8939115.1 ABC transporter ATP-binding protein [Alsobacter ponti]
MAGIQIERVGKRFGGALALDSVSLDVADGEFVALLGPSGCGKTTLLRIVAGLETRSSGAVRIGGRDVSDLRPADRGLAMVFQNYAVFPHMTVFDNVAFGLRMQKKPREDIERKVRRAAALLQIEPYLDRYPAKLSGGQRQRVAVARALAVEPAVLLMDEPLSNLDALLRLEMRAELKSVLREAKTTTLYVTHDQTEAMGLADRIAVMQQGRIVQADAPTTVYSRPASTFVGGFVGSPPMNFVKVTASGRSARLDALDLRPPADGDLLLGFRGEDVQLVPPDEGMTFVVKVAEPMGSHLLLTGSAAGCPVRVVAPPTASVHAGDRLGLRPDPDRIAWMSQDSGLALDGHA